MRMICGGRADQQYFDNTYTLLRIALGFSRLHLEENTVYTPLSDASSHSWLERTSLADLDLGSNITAELAFAFFDY